MVSQTQRFQSVSLLQGPKMSNETNPSNASQLALSQARRKERNRTFPLGAGPQSPINRGTLLLATGFPQPLFTRIQSLTSTRMQTTPSPINSHSPNHFFQFGYWKEDDTRLILRTESTPDLSSFSYFQPSSPPPTLFTRPIATYPTPSYLTDGKRNPSPQKRTYVPMSPQSPETRTPYLRGSPNSSPSPTSKMWAQNMSNISNGDGAEYLGYRRQLAFTMTEIFGSQDTSITRQK
ncbi:MAG: hypothetical protein ACI9BD_001598 [Candidatus Marinamargulisbacteria bacterium]|jgi:hypothetical protein